MFTTIFCTESYTQKATTNRVDNLKPKGIPSSRKEDPGQKKSNKPRQMKPSLNSNSMDEIAEDAQIQEELQSLGASILVMLSDQVVSKEGSPNEFGACVASAFVKHMRLHLHQSLHKPLNCFHSVFVVFTLLKKSTQSESLYQAFKEKEVIGFIFTMMPSLFREESQSIIVSRLETASSFNLNQLIQGGQGFQGQQTLSIPSSQMQTGQGNQVSKEQLGAAY